MSSPSQAPLVGPSAAKRRRLAALELSKGAAAAAAAATAPALRAPVPPTDAANAANAVAAPSPSSQRASHPLPPQATLYGQFPYDRLPTEFATAPSTAAIATALRLTRAGTAGTMVAAAAAAAATAATAAGPAATTTNPQPSAPPLLRRAALDDVLEALLVRGGLKTSDARTTLATRLPPRGVLMLDNPAGAAALALGGKRAVRRRAVAAASLARRQRNRAMPPAPPPAAAGARRAASGPNALSSRLLPRAKRIEALAAAAAVAGGGKGDNSSNTNNKEKDPLKRALVKAAAEGDPALTRAVHQIERQWRDYAAHLLWGSGGGGGGGAGAGAGTGATASAAPQAPALPASLMARLDLHGARVRVESARNKVLEGREGVVLRASWRALLIAEDVTGAAAPSKRRRAKAAAAGETAKPPAPRRPLRALRISCVPRAGTVFSLLLPTPAAAAAPAPAPKRALIGTGGGGGGSTEPFYWREGMAGEALPRPARGGGG